MLTRAPHSSLLLKRYMAPEIFSSDGTGRGEEWKAGKIDKRGRNKTEELGLLGAAAADLEDDGLEMV